MSAKDVFTMALAALVTGLLVGGLSYTALTIATWPAKQAEIAAALAGLAAALAAWLSFLKKWFAILAAERGISEPIQPPGEPKMTRVELSTNGGRSLQFVDLPLDPESLRIFAGELIDGASLTESAWLGSGLFTSRAHFVKFRDACVKKKWLAWLSPGNTSRGLVLTHAGRAVFEYLSDL